MAQPACSGQLLQQTMAGAMRGVLQAQGAQMKIKLEIKY